MTRTARSLALTALALSAVGCAGSAAEAPAPAAAPLTVYKSLGRKQCEAGGETPESLAAQLRAAGLEAKPAGCATDGRMRIAMCGADSGTLGLVDIRPGDAAAAARAGFRPLSELREAERIACPGSPGAPQKK